MQGKYSIEFKIDKNCIGHAKDFIKSYIGGNTLENVIFNIDYNTSIFLKPNLPLHLYTMKN